MKLKNFFNNERKNAVVRELKNDFMPLLEKVTVPVTKYATRNPRADIYPYDADRNRQYYNSVSLYQRICYHEGDGTNGPAISEYEIPGS